MQHVVYCLQCSVLKQNTVTLLLCSTQQQRHGSNWPLDSLSQADREWETDLTESKQTLHRRRVRTSWLTVTSAAKRTSCTHSKTADSGGRPGPVTQHACTEKIENNSNVKINQAWPLLSPLFLKLCSHQLSVPQQRVPSLYLVSKADNTFAHYAPKSRTHCWCKQYNQ